MMGRRRALMMADGEILPPVPSGYITDGLVFFLDGKQLATATKWVDIRGGKVFDLTDCSKGTNGIVFNGSTSYGKCNGAITNDWENETIEVVFDGITNLKTGTIFNQPFMNNKVGIGLRFGDNGAQIRLATAQDGVRRGFYYANITQTKNRLSCSAAYTGNGLCVLNRSQQTSHVESSYGKNESGSTIIGARTTSGETFMNKYTGTIIAVRIYNRKLSVVEMQANQANDLIYYNLS